jgi:phosphate transport system permease protein
MTLFLGFLLVLLIGGAAFMVARGRALELQGSGAGRQRLNSLPVYHGGFAFLWAAAPALLFLAIWTPLQNGLVEASVLSSPAGERLPDFDLARDAILSEARAVATGASDLAFNPEAQALVPAYESAIGRYSLIGSGFALLLAAAGAAFAVSRVRLALRARAGVERWMMALLVTASLVAILTTFGIVASLLFETMSFFSLVSPAEFLLGTQWSPQLALRADQAGSSGAFGSVPLFWGTVFIGAIIAMIVAIPLGLMSAIFLTQYAPAKLRSVLKPLLEILAGVPTVVYGYFAALTVAPMVRDFGLALGVSGASSESALAAGLVMGVMIIPFVSSMADDSIAAVPQAMRDGSLALGATRSETIRKVILPAALPGVVGGVLLAVSRAIGETMIVVMAAGLAANMTANPFASVTTVTTQIVKLLTGDQEFDSPKTLAAFALGLVLFLVTLFLNLVALRVVRRYREAYE